MARQPVEHTTKWLSGICH